MYPYTIEEEPFLVIELPQYPTYAKIANKQRAKLGSKMIKGKLHIDVVINEKKVGKPRYKKINGQDIYRNGIANRWDNSKVIDCIKDFVKPFIKQQEVITEFPIAIRTEMWTTYEQDKVRMKEDELVLPKPKKIRDRSRWDIGNMYIYSKAFDDCLYDDPTEFHKGIIPDDNVDYVIETGGMRFVPIQDYNERKLVVKFFKVKFNDKE